MTNAPRPQIFPYSFKTVASADVAAIGITADNTIGLEVINPTSFYSCEGLYLHLQFLHDGTTAGRNVTSVAVRSDSTTVPTFQRQITTNIAPASLLVDVAMDITGLRNQFGRNVVFIGFDGILSGTIKLFKLDMLYQVTGIR